MTYKPWFSALSKRSFLRYVLIYEVIPNTFFYQINGQRIFDKDTLEKLAGSGRWDDSTVVLELKQEGELQQFFPLSSIKKVLFNSMEAQEGFLERGYENFKLESLATGICDSSSNDSSIDVKPAEKVDRVGFRHDMMWQDGLTALIHDQMVTGSSLSSLMGSCNDERELLLCLLKVESSEGFDKTLAEQFAALCFVNGVEDGWDLNSVVDQLYKNVKVVEPGFDDLDNWINALKLVLNGEFDKPLNFSDDKNIVFRAITLTLFNSEVKAIEAFAKIDTNGVGESVKALATKFSLLRTGYSLLSDEQRQEAGTGRVTLQRIRAHFLNNNWQKLHSIATEGIETKSQSELFLAESKESELGVLGGVPSWLSEGNSKGSTRAYIIKGLGAKANFYPELLVDEVSSFLGLQLLDMTDEKSAKKASPKFSVTSLNLQKDLPLGSRFEITESSFCLALPYTWWSSSDLKTELSQVLTQLAPLEIFKKNKDKIAK